MQDIVIEWDNKSVEPYLNKHMRAYWMTSVRDVEVPACVLAAILYCRKQQLNNAKILCKDI